jgi:cation diffusion facilitator CzcD-associated flavoprotein CzcO
LFEGGGFEFWLANYKDLLFDNKANREAYNFWAKKTRARITDPEKREILAPLEPPHAFGTKRPSLEQNYYEMLDKPENKVVDVKKNPIERITEKGIITADGKLHELDVIALATGFDSVTGGMKNMGLKDVNGVELAEKWKEGMSLIVNQDFSALLLTCWNRNVYILGNDHVRISVSFDL